jgi:hypothetical protein
VLLPQSSHVAFLQDYRTIGEAIFQPERLTQTAYFHNAALNLRVLGHYFGHTTLEGVRTQAIAFATLYNRISRSDLAPVPFSTATGHSSDGSLPIVRQTLTSSTMQLVDGHHRLAIAYVLGQHTARASILSPSLPTTLQSLVLQVNQTKGRQELYQPIDSPEFDASWPAVRRCTDRFALMLDFLTEQAFPLDAASMCDVACSYGWFVRAFTKLGCRAFGLDQDPKALRIGQIAYGLRPGQLLATDLLSFLRHTERSFDIVLCLSVLHHFALAPDFGSPAMLLHHLDRIAGRFLFLDTGQSHEAWFDTSLPAWTDEHILDFLRTHTSFRRITRLGTDSDNVGRYSSNYRRSLFACAR